jgi:Lon protease-like protein
MPIALRIFEERYVVMLSRVLERDSAEFGVVLIERGSEVGGGDERFGTGTIAHITSCDVRQGWISVVAVGDRRFEVVEWLPDDPHPRARIRWLPRLDWSPALAPLRDTAEVAVRRTLARASEYSDQQWPIDVALDDDPVIAAWQLAGIAPLGPLDKVELLRATTMRELLTRVQGLTEAAADMLELVGLDDLGMPPAPNRDPGHPRGVDEP